MPTVTISYNPALPLVSRIFVGSLFLIAGLRTYIYFAGSAAYFAKLGFPEPQVVTWVAIAIEAIGGLLLVIGWYTRPAAWLLIAFVGVATGMAHRFWEFPEAQLQNQLNHFLKNIAIIGGLLMLAAFGPGRVSVDKR